MKPFRLPPVKVLSVTLTTPAALRSDQTRSTCHPDAPGRHRKLDAEAKCGEATDAQLGHTTGRDLSCDDHKRGERRGRGRPEG